MSKKNRGRLRIRPIAGLLLATVAWAGSVCPTAFAAPIGGPPPAVDHVDLHRYLGTWHQLAAVPQPFNLNCARDTTAKYTPRSDGRIGVRNQCTTWSNTRTDIVGVATVNDRRTNAQLHVSFPGVPTQDRPDGPTNYIVTALAPDYSWALVTDPARVSGFVLSRTPALDSTRWRQIRAGIAAAGENPCLYLTSPTTGGRAGIAPLCIQS